MTSRLDLEEVLASARSAAEPEEGEGARVRERLQGLPLAPSRAPLPSAAPVRSAALSLGQVGLWSAGAIGLFLAGFLLGRGSVQRATAPALQASSAAQQRTVELAPLPESRAVVERVPPELAARQARMGELDTEAERAPPTTTVPSGGKSVRSLRGSRARQQPAHATDLHEVVRRLREAQRASRAGDGARALAVLDELDRRVELALLTEERQVTRVLALCSAQQPELARRLAREVLSAHPGSVYAARLEHSCADPQRDEALLDAIRQRVHE